MAAEVKLPKAKRPLSEPQKDLLRMVAAYLVDQYEREQADKEHNDH